MVNHKSPNKKILPSQTGSYYNKMRKSNAENDIYFQENYDYSNNKLHIKKSSKTTNRARRESA